MKQKIKETIKDTIILGTVMLVPMFSMFTWWLVFGY